MSFGLCNAPASFQRCMMSILSDMIEEIMEVFMDDFSVHCLENLDRVLQRCQEKDLILNWEKCHFMVREGIVLGHLVSERGIEVDKAKIEVIEQLLPPINVKGIRSFLGHARFYRRFIANFSQIARPLTSLLAKDVPFQFTDEFLKPSTLLKRHSSQLQSFNPQIGSSRSRSCVMLVITRWGPYLVKPRIRSITRSRTRARHLLELNSTMPQQKKKLLAVVFAIDKFRSYLVGT